MNSSGHSIDQTDVEPNVNDTGGPAEPTAYVNCTDLSHSRLKSLPLVRAIVAGLCFILCLLILTSICCRKAWTGHLQRFFVYLTIASAVYLFTLTMQIEHYFDYPMNSEWKVKVCGTVGYLTELTGSIQLLYTFGVLHHLFAAYCRSHYRVEYVCCCYQCLPRCESTTSCPDVTFLFLSLLLAVLVTLPWLLTPYGESGPWCWIRTFSVGCSESTQGMWEQIALWYIPIATLSLLSVAVVIFALVVCVHGLLTSVQIQLAMKPTVPVAVVLVVYIILCTAEIACSIAAPRVDKYWVWLLYAILPPVSGVAIPSLLLVFYGPEMVRAMVRLFCCRQYNAEQRPETSRESSLPTGMVDPHQHERQN